MPSASRAVMGLTFSPRINHEQYTSRIRRANHRPAALAGNAVRLHTKPTGIEKSLPVMYILTFIPSCRGGMPATRKQWDTTAW